MIYGSHNTMSYLKPRRWWMRFISFCGKCQNNDIEHQLNDGIKVIDIRLKWKENQFIFAHGLYETRVSDNYFGANLTPEQFLYCLVSHLEKRPGTFYLRLTLESSKEDPNSEEAFKKVCDNIVSSQPVQSGKVIPFGGTRKFDWKTIYRFAQDPYYEQYVGSMQSTYGKIWPWLWSKFNRKKAVQYALTRDCICLFDFV